MSTQLDVFTQCSFGPKWTDAECAALASARIVVPRRQPPRTAPEAAPAVLSDASAHVRHYAEVYRIARRSEAARRHDAKSATLTELERAAMRHKADAHALVAEQALAALIRRTQP